MARQRSRVSASSQGRDHLAPEAAKASRARFLPGQYVASTGSLGKTLVGLRAGQALEQVRKAPGGLALANPPTPWTWPSRSR